MLGQSSFADSLGAAIREAKLEDLPALLGTLEQAKAQAWARMAGQGISGKSEPDSRYASAERLLTPTEAATIARVAVKWLFRHTKGLRFRRNLSRKRILFEESGLRKWLDAKRP